MPGEGRRNLYFGTMEKMGWIPTPNRGASFAVNSWDASGTTLNGGGWSRQSADGHLVYTFEWPESSSPVVAQMMRDFRRGTYGSGLIYFLDPMAYTTNLMPLRWADPSIGARGGKSLVYDVDPELVPTSGHAANNLPVKSAYYDLADVIDGYRGDADTLFIPIPPGYTLYLGAFHSTSGNGVISAYEVDSNGNTDTGSAVPLTAVANNATNVVPDQFSGGKGIRIQVGKSSSGAGSVTLSGMIARMYPTGKTPPAMLTSDPWVGGQGHSGCQFDGEPTFVRNTGVGAQGTASYAASFKEVGDWR